MHLKSMIAAALVMTLSLVAYAAPTAQDGDNQATGFLDSVLWPEAFSRHCNGLLGISANLDRQIARSQMKTGAPCTTDQATAISVPPTCPTPDYLIGVLWPIAFDKQDILSRRINAQIECLDTLNRLIY